MATEAQSVSGPASRTRRFHNKSRAGCKGCKERHIKCDEERPVCSNCTRRNAVCEYDKSVEELEEAEAAATPCDSSPEPKPRARKSRKREQPPTNQFTFVDVGTPTVRKRKRVDQGADSEKTKVELSKPKALPDDVEEGVFLKPAPTLYKVVESELENGRQLAEVLRLSEYSPILRGDNEYLPSHIDSEIFTNTNTTAVSSPLTNSPASTNSTVSISRWQSSLSTGLGQSTNGIRITMQDFHLINTYRTFTCETFPYVSRTRNPWKAMTFDLQFRAPYLYHTTLALTSAHLRHLQGVATPSVTEISHYVKGLSSYRESIEQIPNIRAPTMQLGKPPAEIPTETRGLFATSALLGAYIWTSEISDLHSWLISKFAMTVGTREIIHTAWEGTTFRDFREAVGYSLKAVSDKLNGRVPLGKAGMRFPALEALATGKGPNQLLLMDAEEVQYEVPSPTDVTDSDGNTRNIYDEKWAWVDRDECPFYKEADSTMVVDIGSLYRMVCIITNLESHSRDNPLSEEYKGSLMRLIFMWHGLACREVLKALKVRDPRIYLLLAYYYAAVVRLKQINTETMKLLLVTNTETMKTSNSWEQPSESLKAWWLIRNIRFLLRGIVDWLGDEWTQWLEWPLKVLRDEEAAEMIRMQDLWGPAMDNISFT
ncbi:hypothetical protein H072_11106 [Dactylellina haptotyla CBS 200.50]|uniref:Zn(2)-C6 fungal-type domain-containing protein n=1 Tax=Dactylellina haptotyla (strain CBS 200.50) TaxID=1284197 RepID=S7ZYN2_DACHA|nr:hypothetical protein H072_11106 [Dactylellina haptotyla CBS 200.50]